MCGWSAKSLKQYLYVEIAEDEQLIFADSWKNHLATECFIITAQLETFIPVQYKYFCAENTQIDNEQKKLKFQH